MKRNSSISEDDGTPPTFQIDEEIIRQYRRFNATGTELTVRLLPPADGEYSNPFSHFQTGVTDVFEYALRNCQDSDMVGLTIRNEVNVQDKAIGISFRRKDQLSEDVIWSVFEKVAQSNARFNALDKLIIVVHSVKMPVGHGRVKTKGRQLTDMVHLKSSIIEVKAEQNCLAHALIIAIARVNNDPNYKSYRQGHKIRPEVNHLLQTTGIDLTDGGGIPELTRFQEHLNDYRIVIYGGLSCKDIVFDGHVESEKRINLLYDDTTRHYHVITNITAAMSQRYVCKGCGKGCCGDITHKCKESCSDCMSVPPCAFTGVRISCDSCNRSFRSQTCFDKHKTNKLRGKIICVQKRNCAKCKSLLTRKKHECFRLYCTNRKRNSQIGHLCFTYPLQNVLPNSDDVLFVFYDFETTQDTKVSGSASVHVPNLVCLQQFCSLCETRDDIDEDCERCGRRKHEFFEDPVGDLTYLCEPRTWCKRIVAIAHNARGYDAQFILQRAILLKWKPKLILNGLKIICMQMEHLTFDSISYLPMALRKLPEAFGLSVRKSWYPHYFNTLEWRVIEFGRVIVSS
jgi:hypothetical protein